MALTSRLLTKNPEYYTIWNHRRRILQRLCLADPTQIQQRIQDDLEFLLPLLMKFPKCYWIWKHRSWLLYQASEFLELPVALQIWQQELGLIGKMLNRDNRNFHGWNYRRRVVKEIEKLREKERKHQDTSAAEEIASKRNESMVESEFEYTTKMIRLNLSNFSAWHNRSRLIPILLALRKADSAQRRELFDSELALIKDALFTDPYDESLWYYHEYLISILVNPNTGTEQAVDGIGVEDDGSREWITFTNHDREEYLSRELREISALLDDTDDCKWIYQHLLLYAQEYLRVEAGTKTVTTREMRSWLDRLRSLDPLRSRRWQDLEQTLEL